MQHIQGESRHQTTLFPASLDELIPSDHPVRVIDAFVESLDLSALAFTKSQPAPTGRPPSMLWREFLHSLLRGNDASISPAVSETNH